jgi:hypothetical protein
MLGLLRCDAVISVDNQFPPTIPIMISEVTPRSRKIDADYCPLPEEENLVRKDPQKV